MAEPFSVPDEGESIPPAGLSFPAWTMRQIIMGTLTALGVVLAFLLLYRFYMVVFIFFIAVALEVAMRPAVQWLEARGVRRWIGVLAVYALLFIAVGLIVWLIAPMVAEQGRTIAARLPEDYQNVRNWLLQSNSRLLVSLGAALPMEIPLDALLQSSSAASTAGAPGAGAAGAEAVPAGAVGAEAAGTGAAPGAAAAQGGGASSMWTAIRLGSYSLFVALLIFVISFYWTLERELITRRIEMRIPRARREQVRNLIAEMESKIGGYFRGQLILCVIIGVVSVAAFLLLRIPNALMLGLIMGIFEAVPVLGPILGAIPAVIITLAAAPDKVLWVVIALTAIQVLENNLLVPRVMDESVGVNAIISILAIAAFGALFGLAGAVLAIPLAAIVQILINRALFDMPMPEEALAAPANGSPGKRDRLTVLRMETHELIQDVRKQVRSGEGAGDKNRFNEEAEDMIESVAQALDAALVQMEKPA